MQLSVKGKQIDVGDSLRAHVLSSLENTVEKYFDNALEGVVHFSREGQSFRADISVHIGHNILVQSHSLAADPYPAFDGASERVATQLRRYKRRLRDHHRNRNAKESMAAQQYILAPESEEEVRSDNSDADPVIIAEMTTEVETLTVGIAVMRMDLADLPALLFRNSAHGGLNMVYRRGDGNIGWVDPRNGAPSENAAGAK